MATAGAGMLGGSGLMGLAGRPAAYLRVVRGDGVRLAWQQRAAIDGARERGWADPVPYTEYVADTWQAGGPAFGRLRDAVLEGRHGGLMLACPFLLMRPGSELMGLLFACTRLGVEVGFLLPAGVQGVPHGAGASAGPWQNQPRAAG
jgi:hypothetical protein